VLPNGYWLEKDENCWWIGRADLNVALRIVPNALARAGQSIDQQVVEFAEAMFG
jgi:hypothetical protein